MILEALRIIVGSILVLFVPGYALTKALFGKKELDAIETLTLSVALSIAVVPLAVFYANRLLGVKINLLNSLVIILLITACGAGLWYRKKQAGESKKPKGR